MFFILLQVSFECGGFRGIENVEYPCQIQDTGYTRRGQQRHLSELSVSQ